MEIRLYKDPEAEAMKSIVFATIFSAMQLACCGARVRGPEGGLFGIKFGSKPEVMRELMKQVRFYGEKVH